MKHSITKLTLLVSAVALASCAATPEAAISESSSQVGSGSGSATSTITVAYSDGNPTSENPGPAVMTWRCQIPSAVLDTLPIYQGEPAMRSCDLTVSSTRTPPTSVTTSMDCNNSTGQSGYDHFTCSTAVTLLPPGITQSGYFSYGGAGSGSPAIPDASCSAYLERALAICQQTGVAPAE